MQPQQPDAGYSRRILLLIILLNSFINPFLGAAVNVALPEMGKEFSMPAVSLSWVAMAFLLAAVVFLVPFGKAADMIGRKKVFLAGNMVITAGLILCVLSMSGPMLLFSRVVQGMGSAMTFSTGMAIITAAFPPEERGKAIGFSVTAVYMGLSLAPFIGGLLTETFGWRSLFLLTIPFEVLVILLTIRAIRHEWVEARGERFDFRGAFLYMAAMSLFMIGFSHLPGNRAIAMSVAGAAGLVLFILLELRTANPLLNVSLFRDNRVFAFSNLAALINYAATFAITFLLSFYLQYVQGLSPAEAGLLLITQPVLMAVFAPLSGSLSDRLEPRILASTGMTIIVAGLVMLCFLTEHTANAYLVGSLAILGTGFGTFSSPNTHAVMSSVEQRYLGVASATVSTMRLTGQMVSMGLATLMIHLFIGNTAIKPDIYPVFLRAMRLTFVIFTGLCLFGVFASLARGNQSLEPHHPTVSRRSPDEP